jgi:hypothetical protein
MDIRDTPLAIIILLASLATTFALAISGQPEAVWLMQAALGGL